MMVMMAIKVNTALNGETWNKNVDNLYLGVGS